MILSWIGNGNYCDLDLWIEDPSGEETGWSNNPSSSGGVLDHDTTNGHQSGVAYVESAHWVIAPSGQFEVMVRIYGGCSGITEATVYTVLNGVPTTTVVTINSSVNQGPIFNYDSSTRRVLAPYTGPKPDYNAPKNSTNDRV